MPPKHACDACYRRKIQCSITNPDGPCNWCSHHSTECTFIRDNPRRRKRCNTRAVLARERQLLERIRQLEDAEARAARAEEQASTVPSNEEDGCFDRLTTSGGSTSSSVSPSSSPRFVSYCGHADGPSAHPFPLRHHLGPNWFFNGMPLFSEQGCQWMCSKTGQTVEWTKLCGRPVSVQDPYFSADELGTLPDRDTVDRMLAWFFQSSLGLRFPVLDRVLFADTVETALAPVDADSLWSSPDRMAARACVWSVLSAAGRWPRERQALRSVDERTCAAKAYALLMRTAGGEASVVTVQAALLLYMHRRLAGRWQDAGFLLSIASRTVAALGGHVYRPRPRPRPPDPSAPGLSRTERIEQHTRVLFWLCYMADKDVSLQTGQVPLLTDACCDLTLPDNHMDCYARTDRDVDGTQDRNEHSASFSSSSLPLLMGDPRLSHLKEKVYRMLYSARALKNTDGVLLHIRQLDDEMERWRRSIPADFRPRLALPTDAPLIRPGMTMPQTTRLVQLQLEYHHLLSVIHTTVRRHSSEPPDSKVQDVHMVIHSSVDLSLEASRSTLWCLKELISHFREDAFQFIVFYPMTATMSLFLDIVVHPHADTVGLDLERLVSAANVIRSFPAQHLTEDQVRQVQGTSDFIMGLVWLATCAIAKATSGGEEGRKFSRATKEAAQHS